MRLLAGERSPHVRLQHPVSFLAKNLSHGVVENRLPRPSKQLDHGVVAKAHAFLRIGVGNHRRHGIGDQSQLHLARAQRRLDVLALGVVVEHRDLVQRFALGVAHQRDGEMDPDRRAVLAQIALLEPRRLQFARAHAGARGIGLVAVLGMREFLHRAPDQLLVGIAENRAQAAVDAQEASVHVHVSDARAGELEGQAEARLAFSQRLLRLLDLRDVL